MIIVADRTLQLLDELFAPIATLKTFVGRSLHSELLRGADALLVRSITQVDKALLQGSSIRWVGTASAGFDNIDTAALDKMGVAWSSAPGCNAAAVADQILCIAAEALDSGVLSLGDAVGVIGVGEVGRRVVQRLPGLGLCPIPYDPPRAEREENRALADTAPLRLAKMVTLHLPLTRDGRHRTFDLVDEEWLAQFPDLQLLVNSSRGKVVVDRALHQAIDRGLNVALDVWREEPMIDRTLLDKVRWATPHSAGHSRMGKLRGTVMLRRALDQWRGAPQSIDEASWRQDQSVTVAPSSTPVEWIRALSWLRHDDLAMRRALSKESETKERTPFDQLRDSYPARIEFSEVELVGLSSAEQHHSASLLGFARSKREAMIGSPPNRSCKPR